MTAIHGFYASWIDPDGVEHLTSQRAPTLTDLFRIADEQAALHGSVAISAGWYPAPRTFETKNAKPWPPGTYRGH